MKINHLNDFEDERKLGNTTLEIKAIFTTYLVELAVLGNKLLYKGCAPGKGVGIATDHLLRSFTTLRSSNSLTNLDQILNAISINLKGHVLLCVGWINTFPSTELTVSIKDANTLRNCSC